MGELGSHLLAETVESPGVDTLEVLIEGVDENTEREVAFKLGARSGQDNVSASIGASGELRDEPGLSDPGDTDDLKGAGLPGRELIEGVVEPLEFRTAPYEMVGELEDGSSPRLYARPQWPEPRIGSPCRDLRPGWRPDVASPSP
jgi:hypothetical protein